MTLPPFVDLLSKLAGVAGFCLSLFLAVSGFLKNRTSFEISVLDYRSFPGNTVTFYLSIVNKSYTPLVITEVVFQETVCELVPRMVLNEPGDWNMAATPRFPLGIPARSAEFVFLEFRRCGQTPPAADTWVTFQIQTISRRELKTVLLGPPARHLHIKK